MGGDARSAPGQRGTPPVGNPGRSCKISIANVLVGEVWLCSGQSNMEFTLKESENAAEAIAAANNALIRHFKVSHVTDSRPQNDLPGKWAVCSPATAPDFTAVGYYFALQLFDKLNVPIGLIDSSWGGTRIEPWIDATAFARSPKLKDIADRIAGADQQHRQNQLAKLAEIEAWVKVARPALENNKEVPAFPGGLPDHPLKAGDQPASIYNAMIAPLIPYGIRGVIWYQGESNNGEGMLYCEKMKALIGSWRALWGEGDFPFYYVQLAPFIYHKTPSLYNTTEALPGMWEAQRTALEVPNTGMAVITDISVLNNIHPPNKKDVGRRLALWALSKTYGLSGFEFSGPLFKSMKIEGNKAILSFDHADGLKSLDGKPLTWFTIAGADKNFVEAKAEIAGNKVMVTSESVILPAAVRFGWSETAQPNLANAAGLPASPFRTDAW